ncbi:anaerobic ribonucleoside-triphosphate reductase activating protein [Gammaproteobacteria bacterium]
MTDESLLLLHSLAYPVTALGPGRRVALWMAGCRRRCPGCITASLQTRDSGSPVSPAALTMRLLALTANAPDTWDGLTLTGGEPFDQAAALVRLLDGLMPAYPQWTVIAYSGHSLASLQRRNRACRALLQRIDLLIDGPFRAGQPARHPLAGSGNQHLWGLTEPGRMLAATSANGTHSQANLGLASRGQDWLIGVLAPRTRVAWHHHLTAAIPLPDGVS